MGSNGGEDVLISGKEEADCEEATVEIKIKTLDSQTYTLRVDKCVPVLALKEQIASVTGVLSEEQRLICRGKVLKDDQLLSAYHVEDGHTLHLVVRQPVAPTSESTPDPGTDPASASGRSQGSRGPGVLVGSFNISEQDGAFPDLSRVVSAVLGSFGLAGVGSGSEGIDLNELPTERLSNTRNSSRQQASQADSRRQSIPDSGTSSLPSGDRVESLQAPVIPDSLTTLSQNLGRLRQEFAAIVEQNSTSQAAGSQDGQNLDATSYSNVQRGLPTPESLADVMLTARQILNEQAAECLSQLARQLEGQANVTNVSERVGIHSNALRSGILFQNLGAVLLELGRTIMTLRMGETPADAVVNAGPAVFLSTAGPNPIMVQPLPFQPGTGLGAISGGTAQQSSGHSGGSVGPGVFPRNIDIRIRTVGSFMPSTVNRRESTGLQNNGQTAPAASNNGNSVQQAPAGGSATRESEVRVVPIRTVIAAVPASGGRTTSDPSRSALGIVYPDLARVQHVTSGNSGSTRVPQASDQHNADAVEIGSHSIPDYAVQQQHIGIPRVVDSSSLLGEISDGQGVSAQIHSRLDQLLRTIFPGENLHAESGNSQGMDANSGTGHVGAAQNAENSQAAVATASDEGTFLSNLLQQVMPIILENRESSTNNLSSDDRIDEDGNRQDSTLAQEDEERASTSIDCDEPPLEPSSKRQRRD